MASTLGPVGPHKELVMHASDNAWSHGGTDLLIPGLCWVRGHKDGLHPPPAEDEDKDKDVDGDGAEHKPHCVPPPVSARH